MLACDEHDPAGAVMRLFVWKSLDARPETWMRQPKDLPEEQYDSNQPTET